MLIFVHCSLCKTLDDLDIWRFMPFILVFLICSYYLFGIFHSSDYVNLGSLKHRNHRLFKAKSPCLNDDVSSKYCSIEITGSLEDLNILLNFLILDL